MKIIFDSVAELIHFYDINCPGDIGLIDNHDSYCSDCKKCWEQSGLEYELKNEESITMIDKTPTEITYADAVYELIKEECAGLDSIYEDYIIKLVGHCGLAALHRANLIESCGVINCRRLYVLCDKK